MTFSAVAVRILHDFEDLDSGIYMFNENTFMRYTAVFIFFIISQFAALWLFLRCLTILMKCCQSLITTISLFFNAFKYMTSYGVFIQCEIMGFTRIFSNTNDLFCRFIYDNLCFYCVPFLFTGIPFFLFF